MIVEDYASKNVLFDKKISKFDCAFLSSENFDNKELSLIFDTGNIIEDDTLLKEYIHTFPLENGSVLRLTLNDNTFMFALGKNMTVDIIETNYNKKKNKIVIKITGTKTVSNEKPIKEIIDYFKEENNGREN